MKIENMDKYRELQALVVSEARDALNSDDIDEERSCEIFVVTNDDMAIVPYGVVGDDLKVSLTGVNPRVNLDVDYKLGIIPVLIDTYYALVGRITDKELVGNTMTVEQFMFAQQLSDSLKAVLHKHYRCVTPASFLLARKLVAIMESSDSKARHDFLRGFCDATLEGMLKESVREYSVFWLGDGKHLRDPMPTEDPLCVPGVAETEAIHADSMWRWNHISYYMLTSAAKVIVQGNGLTYVFARKVEDGLYDLELIPNNVRYLAKCIRRDINCASVTVAKKMYSQEQV